MRCVRIGVSTRIPGGRRRDEMVGWLVGEKFVELRGRGLHKDGASTP